ncbi:outer membrane protein assembly factor BamA [Bacteroidetes bacterium endosymbiont of Geopemphigus sp.]|uniref:outer membrane protein assembly factor BamA n=1 Tax=Bacteroidetes bacterium endosymbiont of Geopemphigus sp. TaxID=2047937 RepID=UPI000CD2A87A|nr:outer membrane protein assembly factor BamA [Bacteroidetes bacterium endosymbiont of Geopemphigus sp.]
MMKKPFFTSLFTILFLSILSAQSDVQMPNSEEIPYKEAKIYILADVQIKGAEEFTKNQILDFTHLSIGDKIQIPGNKINYAVKRLWDTHLFNDVAIHILKIENHQLYIEIYLEGLPELSEVEITEMKKSQFEEIFKDKSLKSGTKITEDLLNSIRNSLRKYYVDKGYPEAQIHIKTSKDKQNKTKLTIHIEKGTRIKVAQILFEGNKELPNARLQSTIKNTRKKYFLTNIFHPSKYIPEKFEEDLKSIMKKYQSLGFRDAHIMSDSLWKINKRNYGIKIKLDEGQRYHLGNVSFVGNKVFDDDKLKRIFTYKKGDPYDFVGIEKKTSDSQNDASISSAYLDEGYLFSRVIPVETIVKDHTVDVEVYIQENKAAVFNKVKFSGNTITKDHVIARELLTHPGDLFSKSDIKRTLFGLAQLGFFEPEKIIPDIKPNPSNHTVDLEWKLTEKSSSQIQLQGGYGGRRFIGTMALSFGNFSLGNFFKGKEWNPIPQGDGQQLSLSAQGGPRFQSYSISFTEPWISGKTPTSLSSSLNYSKQRISSRENSDGKLNTLGASLGLIKRLNWPDDYFSLSMSLNYDRYFRYNTDMDIKKISKYGVSNDLNYSVSLRRISAGPDPIFPISGSEFDLTGMFTFPCSFFDKNSIKADTKWVDYYKIKIRSYWYTEIVRKLVAKVGGEFGFLGTYGPGKDISPFQRFFIGGTGLLGFRLGGRDYIPLRGYTDAEQANSISPAGGGVVYNRFLLELRYPVVMAGMAKIWVLGFAESGNSVEEYKKYKPFELKRATGLGMRIFMPTFGFLGIDFGYGFDSGLRSKWQTHFVIGRDL